MSNQLQISGAAKIRSIQGPVVANSGVITALDGDASQYVRGDGTLADFPTSTGGGSSVSYYLNTSVSQGTIGGVAYKQLSKVPISGAGTDVTISANGYIASYLTDANDPALLEVPAGNFNCEFYFSVNSNAHNPYVYAEVYKYDGTTFTLLGSSVSVPEYLTNGTTLSPYYFAIPVATSVLTITDRIAVRIFVNVDGRTVTLHTENNHLCQVVTTFSKGLTTLNSLTRQVQFFQTDTSGTDFAISSSVATHTFNLPVASAANTGKLSSTDWSTFNGKVPYTGANANVDLGVYSLTANKLIAGSSSTDNVAIFTTYDEGKAIQLKSSTGDLLFVPFFNPATGARIIAQNTAGSAYSPLSFYASNFYFQSNVNFNSTIGNGTYTYTLPSATGTLALTSQLTGGTVTSVAALTLGTSGTDLSSSVANGTTTPVITLNVPTASATNRGALSSADWTTFNGKQSALTNPVTGTGTTNYISKFTGTSTIGNSLIFDNGTNVGIGNQGTTYTLDVSGTVRGTTSAYFATSSGSVGIGTSSTSAKTEIRGNGNTAINSQGTLFVSSGGTATQTAEVGGQITFGAWLNGDLSVPYPVAAIKGVTESSVTDTNKGALIFATMNNTVNAERMRITSAGNVGIGTSTPAKTLDVFSSNSNATAQIKVRSTGNTSAGYFGVFSNQLYISAGGTYDSGWSIDGTNGIANIVMETSNGGSAIGFGTANSNTTATERMRITSGGQIVMGRTTPSGSGRLTVDGDLYLHNITAGAGQSTLKYNYTSTGLVTYDTSSRLLKKDIENLSYGLDDVLKMSAKKYKWKRDDSIDLGFIADEMVKIIPEIVFFSTEMTNETTGVPIGEPLSINYDRLIPVLVKAIQELNERLNKAGL